MTLNRPKQNLLLTLAWQSIANGLKTGKPLKIDIPDYPIDFSEPCATFVTVKYKHQLRGSFGSLHATRPLAEDVCENAFAAAFCDRHFPSVNDEELADLKIQIDLLSPPEQIIFTSEIELISQLKPHVDGLILEEGSHHACFMPSNWETFHTPMQFLQQLKRKAGLPATYWSKTVKASRFTVDCMS